MLEGAGEVGQMPRVRPVPEPEAVHNAVSARGEGTVGDDGARDLGLAMDVFAGTEGPIFVGRVAVVEEEVDAGIEILQRARSGAKGETAP